MSDRQLRALSWALLVLSVSLDGAGVLLRRDLAGLSTLNHTNGADPGDVLLVLAVSSAGVLIAQHRPRNAVAWLLLGCGITEALCAFGGAYGARALGLPGSSLPLGAWVMALTGPLWVVAVVLPSTLLMLRYPTGQVHSRWARRVERMVWIGLALLWLGYLSSDAVVSDEVLGARSPAPWPDEVVLLAIVGALLQLLGLLFAAGDTIVRTLRAEAPERQQLALLVTVAPLSVVLLFVPWVQLQAWLLAIPFAVAVGVLRYRLLGIEVVVRRTLLYASLSGVVVLVFVAVTSTLSTVLGEGLGPTVIAAVVVAVVLSPARERLQQLVDRFVYGDGRDPWRAFDRLGRETASTDALADVVAAVAESLRLPGVRLCGPDGPVATWGEPGSSTDVPLVVAGEQVGVLQVTPRRGEGSLTVADQRLLSALAPVLGLVLRTTLLAGDLELARARVLFATEVERGRLRRDLHDGLGPSLTGIGLGLEAAQSATPERSHVILGRLREETAASLDEVRRILEDLRPGALDAGGLLASLRSRAEVLTSTTTVRVAVEAPSSLPPLAPDVEVALLRIVDEALTNVVRHAQATACTISLTRHDDGLRVAVIDNGIGYAGPRVGGIGVPSMQSRARSVGGSVELTGRGEGTLLVALLPA